MKFSFQSKTVDTAPVTYVRVRLTEDDKGVKRLVREGKAEYLEIGIGKRSEVTRRTLITSLQ